MKLITTKVLLLCFTLILIAMPASAQQSSAVKKDSKQSAVKQIKTPSQSLLPPDLVLTKVATNPVAVAGNNAVVEYTITVTNNGISDNGAGGDPDGEASSIGNMIVDNIPASLSDVTCTASFYDSSAIVPLGTITEANLVNCVDWGDGVTPRDVFSCDPGSGINGQTFQAGAAQCQVDISGLTDGIANNFDMDLNYILGGDNTWENEFNIFFDSTPVGNLFGGNYGGYGVGANTGAGTVVNGVTTGQLTAQGSHTGSVCTGDTWDVYIYEGFDDAGDDPDSCLQDFSFTVNGHPYVTQVLSGNLLNLSAAAIASTPENCGTLMPTEIVCTGTPDWDALCAAGAPVDFDNTASVADELGVSTEATAAVAFDGVAGCDTLPVEFQELSAFVDKDGNVLVEFSTASETNNAGFSIEHIAGERNIFSDWSEVGYVEGNGTTTEENFYSFVVEELRPGQHAFRVKQIDFDGAHSYSTVTEVTIEVPGDIYLTDAYPNPFNPQTSLTFAVAESQNVTVSLHDASGRLVQTILSENVAGNTIQSIQIDASSLSSGMYIVRFEGHNFVESKQIVLQK